MNARTVIEAGSIYLRHIKPRADPAGSEPGEVLVLGSYLVPQDPRGLNAEGAWSSGEYELRLYEEGTFRLTMPNAQGGDGLPHRERFLVVADRRGYEPGDEWIEIYEVAGPGPPTGQPKFVGTPTHANVSTSSIEIVGADALELQKTTRETSTGFWNHAPRDAFEHYTQAERVYVADAFDDPDQWPAAFGSLAVTPDGRWEHRAVRRGSVPSTVEMSCEAFAEARMTAGIPMAFDETTRNQPLVVDVSFSLQADAPSNTEFGITLGGPEGFLSLYTRFSASGSHRVFVSTVDVGRTLSQSFEWAGEHTARFEVRDRWAFAYMDGKMLVVIPMTWGAPGEETADLTLYTVGGGTAANFVRVSSALVRRYVPFLMRGDDLGDLRLPGAPTPGGLIGEYFDDGDLKTDSLYAKLSLHPLREAYARRVDGPRILFDSGAAAPTWQPAGPAAGEYFSVRWTGAIRLADLSQFDYAVRVNADNNVRLWIGRTRFGEQLIDSWTPDTVGTPATSWLKAGSASSAPPVAQAWGPLAFEDGGWFPIVIEFRNQGGPARCRVEYARSDAPGTWVPVGTSPDVAFSPLGIYAQRVRNDSFFEQLKAISDTFGHQYTCEPRRLESGLFPGEVVPRIRQGRDTDYVLGHPDGVEVRTEIDATGTVARLLIDGQGLADDQAQLTREGLNFAELARHLVVRAEYESLADISIPELLAQRSQSMIALRSSPFEQVSVRPKRKRVFADSFPVTGDALNFEWQPGWGVRLDLPAIGVRDRSCRQALGARWPFVPAGRHPPNLAFRQRPRGLDLVLRDTLRKTLSSDRNYQGQITVLNGALGSNNPGVTPDAYSRVSLPGGAATVKKAVVSVQIVTGSGWTIEINNVATGIVVDRPGPYDVTPWITRLVGQARAYARLTGGTGAHEFTLDVHVAI